MASDWPTARLRELIALTRDGEWGSDQPSDDRIEMLVVRGADFERLRLGELTQMPRRYVKRNIADRKRLCANDVLIETAGGTKDQSTGRSALVKQRHLDSAGLPITCASFARFLRLDERKVDPPFVFYWLQWLHSSGQMEMHQVQHTGVARFQFTRFAESAEMPLPSLAEQGAIAEVLGTLDDKIELNRRTNETLESIARAIFNSWFVVFDPVRAKASGEPPESICRRLGLTPDLLALFPDRLVDSELGEIPYGWEPQRVEQVLELAYGKALKSADRVEGGVPVYGSGGIIGQHNASFVDGPGIIVGRKGTVGSLYWEDRPFFPIDTVFYVVPKVELTFCFYALRTLGLDKMNTDAAVPGLNRSNVYRLVIAIPPGDLRKEFDRLVRPMRECMFVTDQASRSVTEIRDSLLPKLLSGELRIPLEGAA